MRTSTGNASAICCKAIAALACLFVLFLTSPLHAQVVATYDFEDGSTQGWSPFGSPVLTNTISPVIDPVGGTRSLLVTNRTSGFMGPSIELVKVPNMVAGTTYQVSLN